MADWYVVHTLSGHEQKAKRYLEAAIREKGYEDKILEILIPTEDVVEMRQGKRRTVQHKFFPSYILILMELTKETRAVVTSTPGITDFLLTGGEPKPVSEEELARIKARSEGIEATEHRIEIPFSEGDAVKVIDGPFRDFSGTISEINPERGKIKVMVSIFGRLTPVEVDFLQVKEDEE
ncbi:transcription termination/antitermination factor NusG [bacterium]|nr:MAG: transcription termination/antitermination factor NusG [bacterium]